MLLRDEIEQYLAKPRYARSWDFGKALYSQSPWKEKHLEVLFSKGESSIALIKLDAELRSLLSRLPVTNTIIEPSGSRGEPIPAKPMNSREVALKKVSAEINRLKSIRNHHHEQLSIVTTDEARFAHAKQVLAYVKKIDAQWQQWHFLKSGVVIEKETVAPAAPDVTKRIYALRVYISRYKSKVETEVDGVKRDKYLALLNKYEKEMATLSWKTLKRT